MDVLLRVDGSQAGGKGSTKPPDLLGSWRKAVLEEAAFAKARDELGGGDHSVEQLRARAAVILRQLNARPSTRSKAISDTVAAMAEKVAKLDDALSALADPQTPADWAARAATRILWESSSVMVTVDKWKPQEMLVIPKRSISFPTELTPMEVTELQRVSKLLSDITEGVADCGPSQISINPPILLGEKHLHVHVVPPLDRVEEMTDPTVFQAEIARKLAEALGPSTPPTPPSVAGTPADAFG
jgi:diadenosine tetraphosphate (Ap4A) HIT family hydrolase